LAPYLFIPHLVIRNKADDKDPLTTLASFLLSCLSLALPHASLSTIIIYLVMISLELTPPSSFTCHLFLEFLLYPHMLQPSTNCNLTMIPNNKYPQFIMHFPLCSPRVFPIAPGFNPICFAQSPPLLTYIGGPKGEPEIFSI
jgi:hypothetical protein